MIADNKKYCNFSISWVGKCKEEVENDGDKCEKHNHLKCVSCGNPATHDCGETGGLVCGSPLCDECCHNIHPEGHNGMYHVWPKDMKIHCKKTEMKYAPWHVDKENLSRWKELKNIPDNVDIILTNVRN